MSLAKQLKFVQGAVAKKDFIASMTHFCIAGGHVRSFNGKMALGSPIDFNIDCVPKASQLVQAIANCNETVTLAMTPAGRLAVRSGKFKAFVECTTDATPHVQPEGEEVPLDGAAMLKAFETLMPFIGDDASRPWATGVLLQEQSAYATNNVTIVQYWLRARIPRVVNVPREAIKEMLRIGEAPTHAQLTNYSMTFHYTGNRWLRTQLLDVKWPDVDKIMDVPSNAQPMDPKLFEGLEMLRPFVDKFGRVHMRGGKLCTHTEDSEGASFDIELGAEGCYAIEMLRLLDGVATSIDWNGYPKPCMFFGDNLRGALVGLRL